MNNIVAYEKLQGMWDSQTNWNTNQIYQIMGLRLSKQFSQKSQIKLIAITIYVQFLIAAFKVWIGKE